ncbi:MAG TPA: hypothetical protein VHV47_14045 [Opitutaceae bacterium]|jgi:hypothetical protein|nr:hypothetical protein [Opitutaceae bacterium]
MKCRPAAFLAFGALLASGAAWGDDLAEIPAFSIKSESLRLIEIDVRKASLAAASGARVAAADLPNDPTVIKLSPFVVTDKAIPAVLLPRYESRFHRFLRDGTVFQKGAMMLRATFVPTQNAVPIGSAGKPGPAFQLSLNWRF